MRDFFTEVDKRSRKSMVDFLEGHFRYNTMNSWNQSTSYAHNMKLYNLDLDSDVMDTLYQMIQTDEFYEHMRDLTDDFALEHDYRWQTGMNGRSGGYLVLYEGYREPSGYKSFCTACGQKNWTSTTETGTICGVCRQAKRRDFSQTHMKTGVCPGKAIDMHEDFDDWDLDSLRERVSLVQRFDQLADTIVAEAVYLAENYVVEEETIMVPQTRLVMV